MDIRGIDMHLRDMRALEVIKKRALTNGKYRPVKFPQKDIAEEIGCHINTARAIVLRLIRAGFITVEIRQYQGGFVYSIVEKAKAA